MGAHVKEMPLYLNLNDLYIYILGGSIYNSSDKVRLKKHIFLACFPHVSPNNVGHLELENLSTHGEADCKLCSMYNTRYMSHVNYIEHVQIKSFFL